VANPLTRPVSALGSLVELPAQLLDNINRAADAIDEIRQQLGDLADLPGKMESGLRETREAMLVTNEELKAMNEKMATVVALMDRIQERTDRVQSLFRRTTREKGDEEAEVEPASEGAEA
jgi:chromosome segregation ATPase